MANKGRKFPPEVYRRNEITSMEEQFAESATGKRNKALFMVYFRCQLRCSEALDLRPVDVDFERNAITVLNGKGGKRRIVGMDGKTASCIQIWMLERPSNASHLFCTHRGHRMDASYVRRMLKRIGRAAGIKQRMNPHSWRHTGAVKLAESGVPMHIIRRQLGHSSLTTTQRYIDHISADDVVQTVSTVKW